MKRKLLLVTGALAVVGGLFTLVFWDRLAIASAPPKRAASARSEAAVEADKLFWSTFHGARYDDIQHALDILTAAYLQTPNDAVTASHVAWLHMWRVGERARNPQAPATITDDLVLANKYFQEAVKLDPGEARYLGFLAATKLSEGHVDHDERLTRDGFFTMQRAVKAWPEFNLFTAGYVMSRLPPDSQQFADGLEQQWQNMEVCVKAKIDRAGGDYAQYMPLDTKVGHARACWNSSIAPHNLEGFFLNMGDMLVKKGDWKAAQTIYHNATYSKEYAGWKHKDVLAARIANAQANVAEFNKAVPATPMMIDSPIACMGCHED
jgi:hypothetical protein